MKRHLIESIERRKDQMISALWANSNYDDDKGTRKKAIEEIDANYDEAVQRILFGSAYEEGEEIDKSNPFFAKAVEGLAKLEVPRQDEGATVQEAIKSEYEVDQDN